MKLWKLSAIRLIAGAAALAVLTLAALAHSAKAATDIVTGFNSKDVLTPGLVVSVDNSQARSVMAAKADDESKMFGVVVDPSDAPFTLNGQGSKVFVASSGIYRVLVSTSNGIIHPGDFISMSTINGIAAKATAVQSTTLGQAESSFDGTSNVITNNGGQAIGRIYINISIQKNPFANNDPIPVFLKRIAVSLANKPVPVVRIYAALAIFIIAAIVAITILWSGIRNSMVSIGRNPLSRRVILAGLYKIIFTGLSVFVIGVAGVYLLLKI